MSRTYRDDEMFHDPNSDDTTNLTRKLNKLNREIRRLKTQVMKIPQTMLNQLLIVKQHDQHNLTLELLLQGSRILTWVQAAIYSKVNIEIGAKSKIIPQPVITDKYLPASKNLASEEKIGIYKEDKSIHKSKNIIKPATYDGQGSFIDYKSHFDACSSINGWTETESGGNSL
ncbi:unnamed protein product [Mytilus edulis]|uniref:Uncharacterized protein n=1 Tax=Mytilus edulis TaxID=6550 RepID=A0A8S3VFP2_MYTED|nr:unnamed protein product [Mytilus edulis]